MEIYDYTDDEILTLAKKAFSNMEQGSSFVHVEKGTLKASHIISELAERFKMLKNAAPKNENEVKKNGESETIYSAAISKAVENLTNAEYVNWLMENKEMPDYIQALCHRLEKADSLNSISLAIHNADTQRIESLEKLIIKTLLENN